MMACVAKNVVAVRVLLANLRANASYGNSNGMNALMCAARLNDGAANPAESMAASDEIVRLLLTADIQVNASEVAAGNTALHFAVQSQNTKAVERLTERAVQADVSIKNKAGMTVIELGKRVRVTAEIMDRLQRRLVDMDVEASERSLALEKELAQSAASREDEKQEKTTKKKKSKKKPTLTNRKPTEGERVDEKVDTETATTASGEDKVQAPTAATKQTELSNEDLVLEVQVEDDEQSDWLNVATKKNRTFAGKLVHSGICFTGWCYYVCAHMESVVVVLCRKKDVDSGGQQARCRCDLRAEISSTETPQCEEWCKQ